MKYQLPENAPCAYEHWVDHEGKDKGMTVCITYRNIKHYSSIFKDSPSERRLARQRLLAFKFDVNN